MKTCKSCGNSFKNEIKMVHDQDECALAIKGRAKMKTYEEKLITAVKKIISDAMGTDYQLSYDEIDKILQTIPIPPITFKQAFEVFTKELKKNEELYWAYEINIAQAFIDALPKEVITASQPIGVWCSIAKVAARNFLDSLIKERRETSNDKNKYAKGGVKSQGSEQ